MQGNLIGLEGKAPGFFPKSVKSEKLSKKVFFGYHDAFLFFYQDWPWLGGHWAWLA
jgi:hypothetical protein